jgi:hypothetical protein
MIMSWEAAGTLILTIAAIWLVAWLAKRGRTIRLKDASADVATAKSHDHRSDDELDPFPLARSYKAQDSRRTEGNAISKTAGTLLGALLAGVPFLAGLILIGLQIYGWLRNGDWQSVSAIDGLRFFSSNPWLLAPQDWIGVHSILSRLPLSVSLLAIGYFFFWAAFMAED